MDFFSEVPRTRLYVKNGELIKTLFNILSKGTGKTARVNRFEDSFASHFGVSHAVTGSYARVCFYSILKSLDLPPASQIITTPVTIHDMINMIVCAGHTPRFVDIDPLTFQMNPDALVQAITPESRVVLVTHLFGIPSDMERIVAICEKYNLILIEDCSHAFGARYDNKLLGTFGIAGFYSLSSLKSISSGYGGVIISSNSELVNKVRKVLNSYRTCERSDLLDIIIKSIIVGTVTTPGIFTTAFFLIKLLNAINPSIVAGLQTDNPERKLYKSVPEKYLWNFCDIQADLADACLKRLENQNHQRISNAEILYDMLKTAASDRLPVLSEKFLNVFWRFPFRAPEGLAFVRHMNRYGIDVARTLLPCCSDANVYKPFWSPTPHASKAVQDVYFLPVEHGLSEKQIIAVGNAVLTFLRS